MKRTALALALTLAAGAAAAQDAGWYLGASVGNSKISSGGCDEGGALPAGFTCEDSTSTWKIFGGYQFNRNIAVEAGYTDRLGKLEVSGLGQHADVTASAFEVLAVPALPVSENLSLYGKIGIYAASSDVSASSGASMTESNTGGTLGLGAAWHFNKNLTARLDWQRYGKVGGDTVGEADIDTFNIGLLYKF
jgi:OOP family OmpA-OmpF porin